MRRAYDPKTVRHKLRNREAVFTFENRTQEKREAGASPSCCGIRLSSSEEALFGSRGARGIPSFLRSPVVK